MIPLASTVAWLWLSWRLLLSCGRLRAAATAVVALTAVSPWVVFLSTALLSETLFAALLTGSLLLLTRCATNRRPSAGFVRSPGCWRGPASSHAPLE